MPDFLATSKHGWRVEREIVKNRITQSYRRGCLAQYGRPALIPPEISDFGNPPQTISNWTPPLIISTASHITTSITKLPAHESWERNICKPYQAMGLACSSVVWSSLCFLLLCGKMWHTLSLLSVCWELVPLTAHLVYTQTSIAMAWPSRAIGIWKPSNIATLSLRFLLLQKKNNKYIF